MNIKVCGMRNSENIREISRLGVDYMGFIFYPPSPRFVSARPSFLPEEITLTGVFVNSGYKDICAKVEEFGLSAVQLHGMESPAFCRKIREDCGVEVIKAFGIARFSDFYKTEEYQTSCDILLFDTFYKNYGGSGKKFEWNLLSLYNGNLPFFLSGGITLQSAKEILSLKLPNMYGVDINSGFETSPAVKNAEEIKYFINELKLYKQ